MIEQEVKLNGINSHFYKKNQETLQNAQKVSYAENKVIQALNSLLADSTVFYYKLRNYHWNVKGENFFELHNKFEELYEEWSDVIDELAERVKMLKGRPLSTMKEILMHSMLQEDPSVPSDREMVISLTQDLSAMLSKIQEMTFIIEETKDRKTVNMLDNIHDQQRIHLWMLNAWLNKT